MADAAPPTITIRTSCPACGPAGRTHPFVQRETGDWLSCDCGLVFLSDYHPPAGAASAGSAPAPVHAAPDMAAYQQRYAMYDHRQRRRVAKSRQQVLDVLNHVAPGPLLDIGSSLGYTLQAARGLGLPAAGLEMDAAAVQSARDAGHEAMQGTMAHLPWPDGHFQLVVMKHVLEHTPDPRGALAEVRRVLCPGGGLFIAVPHLRYHKAMRNPRTHHWFSLAGDGQGDGHYVYYTPAALTKLLASMGFRVVRVHPHLLHRAAPPATRMAQALLAPVRALWHALLTGARLRKEFWLVAVRDQGPARA